MSWQRRRTKASLPTRGGVLPRQRLFALLDRARGRAVWIAGPPGAGKTTLVSSWLDARRVRCTWYRAQAGDGDLATFFYELGARAGRCRPPLPNFTLEYRGGEAAFSRRFFRQLARRRQTPWALVVDDLQEVRSPEPLLGALREGIEELPEGSRVFLVSRDPPLASFSRLVANDVMSLVGGDQLRLTDGEAFAIARAHAPAMGPEDLERLCARAAGWAAAVVLLATSPSGPGGDPPDRATLFQYLASELFDRADPETMRIFMNAAIPQTLPVRIVNALCRSERATVLLDDLARRAYFVARRGGDEPVFEMHPLAREFLLERGRSTRSPDQLREVTRRAAALLAESGLAGEAVDLYVDAKAWLDAAQLALAQAPELVSTGRVARLETWLDALPPGLAEENPWLWYWHGLCRLPFDPEAARAHLARAWAGFDVGGDLTGLHLAFAAAIDSFILQWTDLRGMDEWIDRFDVVVHTASGPDRLVAHPSVSAMLAALTFRRLGSEALAEWETRALQLAEDAAVPAPTRLLMGQSLLVGCALTGDCLRAAQLVRTLAPLARALSTNVLVTLGWLCSEAVHFWHTGAPAKAEAAAKLGLEIGRETGVHVWDFVLLQQIVLASLAAGDPEKARRTMAAIESSMPIRGSLRIGSWHEIEAILARHEGDAARAVAAARAMAKLARETGVSFSELLGSLHVALGLAEAGDPSARSELEVVRRRNVATRSALVEMTVELAEAGLDLRSGDLAVARDRLARGLRVSREKGIAPDIWFSRGRLAELCALALDSDIETEHVLGLVRRLQLAAPIGCSSDRWPWTVRARLLGPTEVLVRGESLRVVARAYRRPLDVLAALAASESDARGEAIAAALWPDSDGDLAHHALETATYRLRRLVGEDLVRQREGELVLDRGRCWTDVAAFEAHLRRAAAGLGHGRLGDALSAAESAVALYRGPFLPGREEPWVLSARSRHRTRLRRCLSDLERLGADRGGLRRLWASASAADAELSTASNA